MTDRLTESLVEDAALAWLEAIGWRIANGPDITPEQPRAERRDYGEVVLAQRLRDALARLNPELPTEALEDAFRKLTRPEGADLIQRNRALHRLLVDGVTVEYRAADGAVRGAQARVLDLDDPAGNDWLAVNQFSVVENKHSRRPDLVLFVNGMPLAVLELKNPADENATIWSAFQQLQTYQVEVPSLFAPTALLAISDGVEARVGALTAGRDLRLDDLLILNALWQDRRLSTEEAARLTQKANADIRAVLNRLVEIGLVEPRGERKGRTWHLSAASYRRLDKLAAYVRQRGFEPLQREQMVLQYVKKARTDHPARRGGVVPDRPIPSDATAGPVGQRRSAAAPRAAQRRLV